MTTTRSKLAASFAAWAPLWALLPLVAVLAYATFSGSKQAGLALEINLAGRERMLIERFSRQSADMAATEGDLDVSRRLLVHTADALRYGGEVYLDLDLAHMAGVSAARSPEIAAALWELSQLLATLLAAGEACRALPDDPAARAALRDATVAAVVAADGVVRLMEHHARHLNRRDQIVQGVALLAALLVGLLLVFFSRRAHGRLAAAKADSRRHLVLSHEAITEQQLAEVALADSEEEYRTLVQATPAIITRVDRDGTIEFISRTVEGLTIEEVLGTTVFDHLPADQHERARGALAAVFAEGRSGTYETVAVVPPGERRHYRTWIAPRARAGRVDSAILISHDVTEEVNAREELLASHERFQQLAEASTEALFFVDRQGVITDVNEQAVVLLGEPRSSLQGASVLERFGREGREFVRAFLERLEGETFDLPFMGSGAASMPVDVVVSPMVTSVGHPAPEGRDQATAIVAVRDARERKRQEHALEESLERQAFLFDNLPMFAWVGEVTGKQEHPSFLPTWVSENVESVIGLRKDEYQNSAARFTNVLAADRHLPMRVFSEITTGERDGWELTYRWQRPDGRVVWLLDKGLVIRDDRGRVQRVMGVVTDVTEQKKLEAELGQTRKLEAVGKLAGGVAHDFNNLLTVILSFAGFVRDELPVGDRRREDIREVLSAADRGVGLTRQLLLFSRQQPAQQQPFDLNTSLAALTKLLRRSIGEDVDLQIRLAKEAAMLLADPTQLDQVVLNLTVNARDAMPRGGQLRIACEVVEVGKQEGPNAPDPGRYVRLSVQDSGTGMDEETRSHIFEPFFTTKGPAEGTGLGLATCYGVVKQLNGTIEVLSEVGAGTTFTIHLPFFEGEMTTADARAGAGVDIRGNETILVVEDEPTIRHIAQRALSDRGYTVLLAEDGHEALEVFRSNRDSIDLVFSDVVLPRGNGFDLAEAVRELSPKTPVLLTSGYSDGRAIRGAPNDFPMFWKPYTPADLALRIRTCLDLRMVAG